MQWRLVDKSVFGPAWELHKFSHKERRTVPSGMYAGWNDNDDESDFK